MHVIAYMTHGVEPIRTHTAFDPSQNAYKATTNGINAKTISSMASPDI